MKVKEKTSKRKWLGAALVALLGLTASRANATSSTATLNIDVTIAASMSVNITGVYNTTATAGNWNGSVSSMTAVSSVTVTNDSGIITERWELSTMASSWNGATGAAGWTIAGSSANLAADAVTVQAVFGSSFTANNGCAATTSTGTWSQPTIAPILTTTGQQYTTAGVFAATELEQSLGTGNSPIPDVNTNAGSMFGGRSRAMCWRLVMPPSTTQTGTQVVPVVVTAY